MKEDKKNNEIIKIYNGYSIPYKPDPNFIPPKPIALHSDLARKTNESDIIKLRLEMAELKLEMQQQKK